jgi:CHC2 zinc finger
MPAIDFRAARSEISLGTVLGLLHWQPCGGWGEQVRGPCPMHGSSSSRSRSFSAQLGRNVWQCFRCGASGNALDLWAGVTGQPLYSAVLSLYGQLGRTPPWLGSAPSCSSKGEQRLRRRSP